MLRSERIELTIDSKFDNLFFLRLERNDGVERSIFWTKPWGTKIGLYFISLERLWNRWSKSIKDL